MAKKADIAATAPAQEEATGLALSSFFEEDFGFSGMEGLDATDIKTPSIFFNLKGKDDNGYLRQLDEYYVSDTGTYHKELLVVLIALSKSNSFKIFNNTTQKNELYCSSYDRERGTMRKDHPFLQVLEGSERPCENCPDKNWSKDSKGKRVRNCADVFNVFGALLMPDMTMGSEFLIKFAKTSAPPFTEYLGKHHVKKHPHPRMRGRDLPLFAYAVKLTLAVSDNGNYAVPVLEKYAPMPDVTARQCATACKDFLEMREQYVAKLEKDEAAHGGDAMDTTGENVGGGNGGGAYTQDMFADK